MQLIINCSGGKDSAAMLAYLCERYPQHHKHVVFADTGWEYAETKHWASAEQWSRMLAARFDLPLHVVRNPNKDFFSMVRRRGKFPSPAQRQCTSDLKRGPIQTWIRRNTTDRLVINCMGLRAEESSARAKKLKLARDRALSSRRRTVWTWLPIQTWTEKQVLDYLAARDIPLHPAYQFVRRFSCQVCIYMTKADLTAVHQHNPDAIAKIAEVEREIGFTLQPGKTIYETIGGASTLQQKQTASILPTSVCDE